MASRSLALGALFNHLIASTRSRPKTLERLNQGDEFASDWGIQQPVTNFRRLSGRDDAGGIDMAPTVFLAAVVPGSNFAGAEDHFERV